MEIRKAGKNPIKKFKGEWHRYDREMGHPQYKSKDYYFELFDGDVAVGYSSIDIEGGVGRLNELLVRKGSRNKGYGRALVEHFIAFCKKKGCHKATLSTSEKHPEARRLYLGMGFKDEGVKRNDTHHFTWYSMYKFLR